MLGRDPKRPWVKHITLRSVGKPSVGGIDNRRPPRPAFRPMMFSGTTVYRADNGQRCVLSLVGELRN